MENYLETIYILSNRMENVKSIDIAKELNFSKASVSVAMKNLREKNFISIDTNGYITLLESGLEVAKRMYERHEFLFDWLSYLGVDPEIASQDACKIEHVISQETFDALKEHVKHKKSQQNNLRGVK
jgi:Mn-dependent DtxR family transcriptional regulator